MLMRLPHGFRESEGGGWSFLNGCTDESGELWTGMQSTVECLMALGLALGFVTYLLPRDVWHALPGGVPYFAVRDREIAVLR